MRTKQRLVCEYCGRVLWSTRSDALYHPACKQKVYRENLLDQAERAAHRAAKLAQDEAERAELAKLPPQMTFIPNKPGQPVAVGTVHPWPLSPYWEEQLRPQAIAVYWIEKGIESKILVYPYLNDQGVNYVVPLDKLEQYFGTLSAEIRRRFPRPAKDLFKLYRTERGRVAIIADPPGN